MSSYASSMVGDGRAARRVMAEMPVYLPPGASRVDKQKAPQKKIDEFWRKFTAKDPGKATTLLPKNEYAEKLARRKAAKEGGSGTAAQASFEEAAALCKAKVDKIIDECRRVNQKYRDPHFDLEFDLKMDKRDCLESLDRERDGYSSSDSDPSRSPSPPPSRRHHRHRRRTRHAMDDLPVGVEAGHEEPASPLRPNGRNPGCRFSPKSVKRVGEIFDDPKFYIDGPTANDVRQGRDGDCWLMAALCTLSNKPGLIERICVHHDQAVGVYGFVFHRDGEWFSEIIDDKLYLTKPDYDEYMSDRINIERLLWDDGRERPDSEEIYRKTYQSNSGALYFAQCANPNETWLPLLEKAYAKAHGDYAAIEGGYTGEGIEDLTGGVTSELFTTDILDTEDFWNKELMQVNKEFLFGCSTGLWGRGWGDRKGIVEQHAYSVMRAVELDGERLLLLKNPWGKSEWKGPWSDGSKEWTPEWLKKLDHRFGDDGAFWISYKELLRKYQNFDRTRLFGPDWKITSIWTTLSVPWTIEYHDTKFAFTLAKDGPVVLVLSQLDDRYFRGLQGQYSFNLAFRVHKAGHDDYLVRTQGSYRMKRSVNVELTLEAGEYIVLVKIDASRIDCLPPEDVVRKNAKYRREKLLRIGLAYDLAHSKAKTVETPEEKAAREAYEKRKKDRYRERVRKAMVKEREKKYYAMEKAYEAQKKMIRRKKAKEKARAERRRAKEKEAQEKYRESLHAQQVRHREMMLGREAGPRPDGRPKNDQGEESKPVEKPGGQAKVEEGSPATETHKEGAKDPTSPPEQVSQDSKTAEQPAPDSDGAKVDVAEPDTLTDTGEHTPPTSSSTGSNAEAPAEDQTAPRNATDDGDKLAPVEARLESQASFHTSFTSVPENSDEPAEDGSRTDTPKQAGTDGPSTEKSGDEDQESKSGVPAQEVPKPKTEGKERDREQEVPKPNTEGEERDREQEVVPKDQGPRQEAREFLSPELERELREMVQALDTVSRGKQRLKALLGEDDSGDESNSGSSDEGSRPPSRGPSRHHSRPPSAQRHPHPHHQRPPPQQGQIRPGPPQPYNYQRTRSGPPETYQYYPSRGPPPDPGRSRPPPPPPGYVLERRDPRVERQPPPPPGGYYSDEDSDASDGMLSLAALSDVTDRELDYRVEETLRQFDHIPQPRPPPPVMPRVEPEDEFEKDPWNAVAVVGLRIYYKVAEEDKDKEIVTLRVIRPNRFEFDDDEDAKKDDKDEEKPEEEGTDEAKVLDLDDSAKDATVIV